MDHPGEERAVHCEPSPLRFVAGICVFQIYFPKGKRPYYIDMLSGNVIKLISNKAEDAPARCLLCAVLARLHGCAFGCMCQGVAQGARGLPRQCPELLAAAQAAAPCAGFGRAPFQSPRVRAAVGARRDRARLARARGRPYSGDDSTTSMVKRTNFVTMAWKILTPKLIQAAGRTYRLLSFWNSRFRRARSERWGRTQEIAFVEREESLRTAIYAAV
jgi:hypothetical protein